MSMIMQKSMKLSNKCFNYTWYLTYVCMKDDLMYFSNKLLVWWCTKIFFFLFDYVVFTFPKIQYEIMEWNFIIIYYLQNNIS